MGRLTPSIGSAGGEHPLKGQESQKNLQSLVTRGCHGPITIFELNAESVEQLRAKGQCRRGAVEGRAQWYSTTGIKIGEQHYLRGQLHGNAKTWHANGRLATRGAHQRGKRHGHWGEWFSTGSRFHVGGYHEGNPRGRHRTWYSNGRPRSDLRFSSAADLIKCARPSPLGVGTIGFGTSLARPISPCAAVAKQLVGEWTLWHRNGRVAMRGRGRQVIGSWRPDGSRGRPAPHVQVLGATSSEEGVHQEARAQVSLLARRSMGRYRAVLEHCFQRRGPVRPEQSGLIPMRARFDCDGDRSCRISAVSAPLDELLTGGTCSRFVNRRFLGRLGTSGQLELEVTAVAWSFFSLD